MPLDTAFIARSWLVLRQRTRVTEPKAPRPSSPTSSRSCRLYSAVSSCRTRMGRTVFGTFGTVLARPAEKSQEKRPNCCSGCCCGCSVEPLAPPQKDKLKKPELGGMSRGVFSGSAAGPACVSGWAPLFRASRSSTSSCRKTQACSSLMPSHLWTLRERQASGESPAYSSSAVQLTWEPREWKESRRFCGRSRGRASASPGTGCSEASGSAPEASSLQPEPSLSCVSLRSSTARRFWMVAGAGSERMRQIMGRSLLSTEGSSSDSAAWLS
mmetsp:Transcript_24232/g.76199  ORF Transcript_24232/g.76199 Transcript_24232/m.76199 type:complete len:270 (-) Transcript_24232:720-1529(-)